MKSTRFLSAAFLAVLMVPAFAQPDDDSDGLPNLLEDVNQNGRIDVGETDPAMTDTDGDGVSDRDDGLPRDPTRHFTELGAPLDLVPGGSLRIPFTNHFLFPFYGDYYNHVYVNANGTLSFGTAVSSDLAFDSWRGGPPAITPASAPYDPAPHTKAGRRGIFVQQYADRFIVTYYQVPTVDSPEPNTVQVALIESGLIRIQYSDMALTETLSGITPGQEAGLRWADFSSMSESLSFDPSQGVYEIATVESPFDLSGATLYFAPGPPEEKGRTAMTGVMMSPNYDVTDVFMTTSGGISQSDSYDILTTMDTSAAHGHMESTNYKIDLGPLVGLTQNTPVAPLGNELWVDPDDGIPREGDAFPPYIGSIDRPFKSIQDALDFRAAKLPADEVVTINLSAGASDQGPKVYDESFDFEPNTVIRGRFRDANRLDEIPPPLRTRIESEATGSGASEAVVRANTDTALRDLSFLAKTGNNAPLLRISAVNMLVENVWFIGDFDIPGTRGIIVADTGDTAIRRCYFNQLDIAIRTDDAAAIITGNVFDRMSGDVLEILFSDPNQPNLPNLGDRDELGNTTFVRTAFNRFGNLLEDTKYIRLFNDTAQLVSAEYNEWEEFDGDAIGDRIVGLSATDRADVEFFFGPDQAIFQSNGVKGVVPTDFVAGVILDAQTKDPIPGSEAVLDNGAQVAPADSSNGAFLFSAVPTAEGRVTVFAQADGYVEATPVSVAVGSGLSQNLNFNLIPEDAGPAASFTFERVGGSSSTTFQFTDTSISSTQGGITDWNWQFGDGSGSTEQNPVHTYSGTGTFTVTLTVTDPVGQDQATDEVTIQAPPPPLPMADFSGGPELSGDAPLRLEFVDESEVAAGLDFMSWDFGDGTTRTEADPAVTYRMPGTYTVSLLVRDTLGREDTRVRNGYVTVTGNRAEDLNDDSEVNAVDVQLVVNGALDIPSEFPTDVNLDGSTNAVDVQLVINAVLGIG